MSTATKSFAQSPCEESNLDNLIRSQMPDAVGTESAAPAGEKPDWPWPALEANASIKTAGFRPTEEASTV